MTGPVERVPPTDGQPRIDLAAVRRDVSRANDPAVAGEGRRVVEGRVRYAASALIDEVERLAAELQASRAREAELLEAFQNASDSADEWCAAEEKITAERDELQQRIDRLLAHCDQEEADDLAVQVGQYPGSFIETTKVRAALIGTETTDAEH